MEIIKELAIVFGRIISILPLMLIVTLYMGKRSIGELPVFDFLIIIALGAVVGADIADPNINHLPTAFAIVLIGILQKFITKMAIRYRWFGKLVNFEPTVVIHKGAILNKQLKKIRYSLDDILQMLREINIYDVREVEIAIIEANGKLTAHKIASNDNFTFPIIIEGKIDQKILNYLSLSESWLRQQLKEKGYANLSDIFFASVNNRKELHISALNPSEHKIPPIRH